MWIHLASKLLTHPECLQQRQAYKAEAWTDGRKYGLIAPLHLDHYIQFRVTCNIQQIIGAAAVTGRGGAAGQCTRGRLPCPRRKYKDNLIGSDTQLSGRRVSRLISDAGALHSPARDRCASRAQHTIVLPLVINLRDTSRP